MPPKNRKLLILALVFATLNMIAIFVIFGFQEYGDTSEYLRMIDWLRGEESQLASPWYILRPVAPLLAAPFEFMGAGAGLIVQNIFFYFFCTFLIFKIVELIYHNKKQALLASMVFVTSTTVIEVGLSYLIDTGAWFFYLLSIFLTIFYLQKGSRALVILNGFVCGLGFLMKENGAMGILFFVAMILITEKLNRREKLLDIARFGLSFLTPVVMFQFFVYQHFHFTSLHKYFMHVSESENEGPFIVFLRYVGQFFRVMGILWIFFFLGLWRELKNKNNQRLKIFLALLPASLSFLLWPISGGRHAFIFAPLGILLTSYGLILLTEKFGKKVGYSLMASVLIINVAINYCFAWWNSSIPFVDKIAEFIGIL